MQTHEAPALLVAAPDAAPPDRPGGRDSPEPIAIRMPVDITSVSLTTLVVIAAIFALRELAAVLVPVVLSMLFFYALDPIVDRLDRYLPRAIATTLVVGSLIGALGGMAYSLNDETIRLISDLPDAARKLRATLASQSPPDGLFSRVRQAATELEKAASEAVATKPTRGVQRVEVTEPPVKVTEYVWWGSLGTLALLGQALVVLLLTFFLLLSNDLYKRKLVKLTGPTLARKKITVQVLAAISQQIERFLFVQVFTSAVVGLVTGLALWWLGVEQPAVWGLLAGVFNSIPYFGPLIVSAGLGTVALLQFGTLWDALVIAAVAMAITSAEGYILTPLLISRASQMNRIAVFISLLFWSWVWGVVGALLAIPIMVVIKAVADHVEDLQPVAELLGE